jgi:hypothetical protein
MMPTISRDTPRLSITSVARDRLPVLRKDATKGIMCVALDEARRSGGFPFFAYVIMPARKGTDLSVPNKGDNGARPLGPECSGFSG